MRQQREVDNPHLFLEAWSTGRARTQVVCHLVAPICATGLLEAPAHFALETCIMCQSQVIDAGMVPHQLALRLIVSCNQRAALWFYDPMMSVLCPQCHTADLSLPLLDGDQQGHLLRTLHDRISKHPFRQVHIGAQYLEQLIRLNEMAEDIWLALGYIKKDLLFDAVRIRAVTALGGLAQPFEADCSRRICVKLLKKSREAEEARIAPLDEVEDDAAEESLG